jgi:hypothetical protein
MTSTMPVQLDPAPKKSVAGAAGHPWPVRYVRALTWLWRGPEHDGRARWYVSNQTPRLIWLKNDSGVFTLAPLERRRLADDPRRSHPELANLVNRHELLLSKQAADPADVSLALTIRVWLIIGFLWLVSFWPLSTWWWQRIGAVLGIAAGLSFLLLLTRPATRNRDGEGVDDTEEVASWNAAGIEVGRRTWNSAVMLAVLAISVLMPAAALYFATDFHDVLVLRPTGVAVDTSKPLVLIGRLVQLTFLVVATILPALLYFQFDAERLVTLRDRWMQNVFRLDPTVYTVSDVTAKYGRQLDEAYGRPDAGRGRLVRGRRSPIVLATLVLAFGWLLILLRAGATVDSDLEGKDGLLVRLLDPNPSLITYGFLGVYFFAVQLVWNSYVRADLRPKTYTTITVRVLVVVVLAWLIEAALGDTQPAKVLYFLAFLAGIMPNTVLHLVAEKVLGQPWRLFNQDRLVQLTELEGIDLYERTRLSEEGITSVEALAHHDLLDLFFKTRIAPARLIDWVDQAILIMHLGSTANGPGRQRSSALRAALRAAGIRTATDLVSAIRPDSERCPCGAEAPERTDAPGLESVVQFASAAMVGTGPAGPTMSPHEIRELLTVVSATLDRSEWIGRIENWRRSDLIEAHQCGRRYIGADGDLRPGDPRSRLDPRPGEPSQRAAAGGQSAWHSE